MYEKHGSLLRSWYTSWHEVPTETLAYRLLLVEQAGLRPLSVQASRPRDYGQPGWVESRVSERGKRAYIAVDGSGMDPDAFRAKLALVGSAADSAGDAGARALRQLQLLQAEARQEVARLNALLPPELQL